MSKDPQTLFELAETGKEPVLGATKRGDWFHNAMQSIAQGQTQDPQTRTIHIHGTPAPQGSKKAFAIKKGGAYTGRTTMVESSSKVKPWRAEVVKAATDGEKIQGPVSVAVTFYLARPKSHYGTGRNAGTLKPAAPGLPGVKPDVDKLVRSTLDGLTTAGVYEDDARVTDLVVAKRYADGRGPGALVRVSAACRPS
ncbi:RusA family crossover junction endodeoxyribonuclease [Paeniglutamicibacter sp. R2-26]|uniref:RusA family crossover junction endodeoxyribonuclease n=1 Tax=Paeniglutamicibacter sp. R2-26 TaxID=3144417 RepID=UPI003EE76FD2